MILSNKIEIVYIQWDLYQRRFSYHLKLIVIRVILSIKCIISYLNLKCMNAKYNDLPIINESSQTKMITVYCFFITIKI